MVRLFCSGSSWGRVEFISVLSLMLLFQLVGLVKIALGKLSMEKHEYMDDLLSGVHEDYSLQEVQCKRDKFCIWKFD